MLILNNREGEGEGEGEVEIMNINRTRDCIKYLQHNDYNLYQLKENCLRNSTKTEFVHGYKSLKCSHITTVAPLDIAKVYKLGEVIFKGLEPHQVSSQK